MRLASFLRCWDILAILTYVDIVNSSTVIEGGNLKIDCQQKSTSGRDYIGEANTTVDGIPCQRWSETQPHDHKFTHVGDHNFCRNPNGAFKSQVWCFTTDPEVRYQNCPIPLCPTLKALDFSLDNDQKIDENNSSTHAFLKKGKSFSLLHYMYCFHGGGLDLKWKQCKDLCPP